MMGPHGRKRGKVHRESTHLNEWDHGCQEADAVKAPVAQGHGQEEKYACHIGPAHAKWGHPAKVAQVYDGVRQVECGEGSV